MARYESACLGDGDLVVYCTNADVERPFRLIGQNDELTEISLTKEEARDLAVFLIKYLYEYVGD